MRASVVIPCVRYAGTLERVLNGFAAQSCGPRAFSVVIVEHGNGEGGSASKPPRKAGYPFSMEIVRAEQSGGRSAAFNRGISRAEGELVVLGCEDIIPGKSFMEECLQTMESVGGCDVAVLGEIAWHPELPKNPLMGYIRPGLLSPVTCQEPPRYRYFKAGVVCLRRDVLERGKGFDEEFGSSGWEDVELGYRLFRGGVGLAFHPGVVGYQCRRPHWSWFCAEVERSAEASLIFHRKHPECREETPGFHLARVDPRTRVRWTNLARNLGRIIPKMEKLLKSVPRPELHASLRMLYECYSIGLEVAYGRGLGRGLEAPPGRYSSEFPGVSRDPARLADRLPDLEIRLAKAWEFVGGAAQARRIYERVVREGERVEKIAAAMGELAEIYERRGDCRKLVQLYRALMGLTRNPFSLQLYAYRMAQTFEKMGLFSRAISSYRKMLELERLTKEFETAALFRLGLLCRMGFGTEAEAEESFRKCLELTPSHPGARAELGIAGAPARSSLVCLTEEMR
jgi:GT2 family glycosyltransferase/tetratricopeptide (TPR) repeat protein